MLTILASDPERVDFEYTIYNVTEGNGYMVRARSLSPYTSHPSPWTEPIKTFVTEHGKTMIYIHYNNMYVLPL